MSIRIHAAEITACCSTPAAAAVAVEVVECTGSTNADLMARLTSPHPTADTLREPTLRLALRQTAGRGRAGRVWHSDAGSLTFSLAWRFARPVTALSGLSLAVGVTVAEVLRARDVRVSLKWPNDLLQGDGKLGGILIETAGGGSLLREECWAVIGIGINMQVACSVSTSNRPALTGAVGAPPHHATAPRFPTDTPAVAMHPAQSASASRYGMVALPVAALPAADRTILTAALLDALAVNLSTFDASGFAPFAARWNCLHAHAGRLVDIVDRGQVLHSGDAFGVDGGGRLLLDTAQGRVAVVAGDVSLRASEEARDAASG